LLAVERKRLCSFDPDRIDSSIRVVTEYMEFSFMKNGNRTAETKSFPDIDDIFKREFNSCVTRIMGEVKGN
jgi:hypothetical protein